MGIRGPGGLATPRSKARQGGTDRNPFPRPDRPAVHPIGCTKRARSAEKCHLQEGPRASGRLLHMRARSLVLLVTGITLLALVPTMFAGNVAATGPVTPSYTNYPGPDPAGDNSGEPTLGVNWNTGNVMIDAFGFGEYRVTFDDAFSPATAVWT